MRLKGIAVETIYLELLAPVARHLGSLWEQDLCDFTEVTIGLGRLHQVLRELSPGFSQSVGHAGNGRRILLLPSPGEQHTFGLVMVSEFFRHAGWDVAGGPWEAGADPVTMVKREWFDVVGFSLGFRIASGRFVSLHPGRAKSRRQSPSWHNGWRADLWSASGICRPCRRRWCGIRRPQGTGRRRKIVSQPPGELTGMVESNIKKERNAGGKATTTDGAF